MLKHLITCLFLFSGPSLAVLVADEAKPHAVFVIGTPHYEPQTTMPVLARELERCGFRTTVIRSKEDPEKNPKGIPGLQALRDADLAVFFLRFLTLPDNQLREITDYLEAGRPVVGFRTSSHAFAYPDNSPHAHWNNGFGRDALGSPYYIHLQGTTKVRAAEGTKAHPILDRVTLPLTAAGTLYFSTPPPKASVLLYGTGRSKKTGSVTNQFGTHLLEEQMTQPVAWTWTNKWGGRTFSTSLGHPDSFREAAFVRFCLNGICWAAKRSVPATLKIRGFDAKTRANAANPGIPNRQDGRNQSTGRPEPFEDPAYKQYGIYAATTPRAAQIDPTATRLPLQLPKNARIALVGNTLFDRNSRFGHFETLLHQRFPQHQLTIRTLSWPADTVDLQPRPENFADQEQHLTYEKTDVIFAAYGYNESFAGPDGVPAFRESLTKYIRRLKSRAFNGRTAPQVILVSPVANENIGAVQAADLNNDNISLYTQVMKEVAAAEEVGFADVLTDTQAAMAAPETDLTLNGAHLTEYGNEVFARALYRQIFDEEASALNDALRQNVIDTNRQYFRRYRPLNTFYYTGGRNKAYGYLDFLPAMRNFDLMTINRDRRSWELANGHEAAGPVDDSQIPPLPETKQSRGANRWMSAEDELREFEIDPRFDVTLFAGEEEFPEIAAPIQMRWDTRGRLWVACSTTYPHVYPGLEPNDRIVILEDTDQDGRADKSTVFADDVHIPLSFEFGNGGVYVSEEPDLTFLQDTDGDDRADVRTELLTGFGTEDSHHALHDFVWTPDGDLIFREGIFHHTQVETPYGPVRQQNSGWYRFDPPSHRLQSFGTYHSTNPWGVTFDPWGQHMASHPIYAAAFHAPDPPYPEQHPKPAGLQAYSGTCGHAFVDSPSFPDELQGMFIKARYKPTNRIEILRWKEGPFGYEEEYVSDLIFSRNLSFIPVDLRFGPQGDLYICDWYNPVKGHAQYSLRDERRDRHSGRIWRVTAKGRPLQSMPEIAQADAAATLQLLKHREYRIRYMAKHRLRQLAATQDLSAPLDHFVQTLDTTSADYRRHQLEALWAYRICRVAGRGELTPADSPSGNSARTLLRDLLGCEDHRARAAAVEQLRYWGTAAETADGPRLHQLLKAAANDANGIVRMQAAIACSYVGTPEALDACLETLNHPADKHTAYAIRCALGSAPLRRHWEDNPRYNLERIMRRLQRSSELKEPAPTAAESEFDRQRDLATVRISCIPERMLFTKAEFRVQPNQPVKVIFTNPDATDHNLVVVEPEALAEVGIAANAMARDPANANSDFIPNEKRHLIVEASPMIGPTRTSQVHVLRFEAPSAPGIYPYVCTFPGHWIIMNGRMIVAESDAQARALMAAEQPANIRKWTLADFPDLTIREDEETAVLGMQAFVKARCNQCHVMAGHGIALGPDLTDVKRRFRGEKLLAQIIHPSQELNEKYRNQQFILKDGRLLTGVVVDESREELKVIPNLLNPNAFIRLQRADIEEQIPSTVSAMPEGLINVLTEQEIRALVSFLQTGGYKLPEHLRHHSMNHHQ